MAMASDYNKLFIWGKNSEENMVWSGREIIISLKLKRGSSYQGFQLLIIVNVQFTT